MCGSTMGKHFNIIKEPFLNFCMYIEEIDRRSTGWCKKVDLLVTKKVELVSG